MSRTPRLCRTCGLDDWSALIKKVVYYSGRGKGMTEIEVQGKARICVACFYPIHIAKAFERSLPKGFAWTAAKVFYRGISKVDEVERMLPERG